MNEDKKRIKARDELSNLMAQEYSLVFVKSDLDLIIDCVLPRCAKSPASLGRGWIARRR